MLMENTDPLKFKPPLFSHSVPSSFEALVTMTNGILTGLTTRGKGVMELEFAEKLVRRDLAAAVSAHSEYQTFHASLDALLRPALRQVKGETAALFPRVKRVLGMHLGQKWNRGWQEAGLSAQSTSLPKKAADQEVLLSDLASYFASHPEFESANFGVTAERCRQLHTRLTSARAAVKSHPVQVVERREAFQKASDALGKRVRATIAELEIHVERDSALWGAYGLIAPADKKGRQPKKIDAAVAKPARETKPAAAVDATRSVELAH
jgi:hypothetical protein